MKQFSVLALLIIGSVLIFSQQSFAQSYIDIQVDEDCSLEMFLEQRGTNFKDFTLEWSEDGEKFEILEVIDPANFQTNRQVTLLNNPQSIQNYFRLKMTDGDEAIAYSNTVHLLNDCGVDGYLQVYPNPIQVDDYLNINFFTDKMNMDITLYQNTGEIVQTLSVETPNEWNAMSIDLSKVESGDYFVEVGDIGMTAFTIATKN